MALREYCGSPGLTDTTRSCILGKGHTEKHQDWNGNRWATPGQVSGNDRWAAREEQLQELLTYCKTQDGRYMTPRQAYVDVASKLKKILDGAR